MIQGNHSRENISFVHLTYTINFSFQLLFKLYDELNI